MRFCWLIPLLIPLLFVLLTSTLTARGGRVDQDTPTGAHPEVPPLGECTDCHEIEKLFSHPTGIRPSMRVPAHMPLADGRLVCVTCHETGQGSESGSPRRAGLLRAGPSGNAFCTQCHASARERRSELHGSSVRRAHIRWPKAKRGGLGRWPDASERARDCLACHDGVIARDAGGRHDVGPGARGGRHPTDIPYHPGAGARGGGRTNARLVPIALLDRRIRLFDGRVGCGSCHSPFSTESSLMVLPSRRSRLCFGCHDM